MQVGGGGEETATKRGAIQTKKKEMYENKAASSACGH